MTGWIKLFTDNTTISSVDFPSWSKTRLDGIKTVIVFSDLEGSLVSQSIFNKGVGEYHYSEDYEIIQNGKPDLVLQRVQFRLPDNKWDTLEIETNGYERSYISEVRI